MSQLAKTRKRLNMESKKYNKRKKKAKKARTKFNSFAEKHKEIRSEYYKQLDKCFENIIKLNSKISDNAKRGANISHPVGTWVDGYVFNYDNNAPIWTNNLKEELSYLTESFLKELKYDTKDNILLNEYKDAFFTLNINKPELKKEDINFKYIRKFLKSSLKWNRIIPTNMLESEERTKRLHNKFINLQKKVISYRKKVIKRIYQKLDEAEVLISFYEADAKLCSKDSEDAKYNRNLETKIITEFCSFSYYRINELMELNKLILNRARDFVLSDTLDLSSIHTDFYDKFLDSMIGEDFEEEAIYYALDSLCEKATEEE